MVAFIAACFISFSVSAYEIEQLASYQQKYPNTMGVVLDHSQRVSLMVNSKTGELEIYETDYEEVLYLKETSKFYTSQSIYTSEFFEDITEISVVIYTNKGKKIKMASSDFQIVDSAPSSWVFHDDDKELTYKLKALGEGYRTVIEYTKRVKRPEFFELFHFMSGYPMEKSRIEIVHAPSTELKFFEENLENEQVVRETNTLKKGNIEHVWEMNDLPEYKTEDGSTDMNNHLPYLIAQIVKYELYGEEIKVIGSADDLHGYFQDFLLLTDENEAKAKTKKEKGGMYEVVDSITVGMENDLERMDTIFRWVQANVKYIAVEDGINGYVPRPCTEVMNNRYGDCKDMGNLLVQMLEYANVPGAHVAWVGTRDIVFLMSDIPTPMACNHVICVVDRPDGGYYYLDATDSEGSYRIPPRSIQSKDLLIHLGKDKYTLYNVPAVAAKNNYFKSVLRYHWDEDDSIRGTGSDFYGGYERSRRTYSLGNLDNEDLEMYVKNLALGGANRYELDSFDIRHLNDKEQELIIDYAFAVDNLFVEDGDQLILNPALFKPRISKYNTTDHSLTRNKDYHRHVEYHYEFEIPTGYEVVHLPEGNSYAHELFSFESSFAIENGVLVLKMMYEYHLLEIPTALYEEWNKFSSSINMTTTQNVIFQKTA